jgi:transposase
MGRPGLPPGMYFRLLLIGYFEGIDSERGIAWRAADSFALRDFLGVGLEDARPDHSTISRTPRLIDLETHRAVFTWVLPQSWIDQEAERDALYANRRRIRGLTRSWSLYR